jgi:hypothetical protein
MVKEVPYAFKMYHKSYYLWILFRLKPTKIHHKISFMDHKRKIHE